MLTSMVTRETIIRFWWAGVGVGEARRSRCRERRSHAINAFDPATRSVRNVKKRGSYFVTCQEVIAVFGFLECNAGE
jgi:hypothetical protein